jgi:hypothetical protein
MDFPRRDIVIPRGDDYDIALRFRNADGTYEDLSSATVIAQVREEPEPDALLLAEFVVDLSAASTGWVLMTIPDEVTGLITTDGAWDIRITVGGKTRTRLGGDMTLRRTSSWSEA